MSHTPGPWTYQRRRSDEYLIKGESGAGYIATVYAAMVGDGPFEANARLIAAAPAMLEALKFSLSVHKAQGQFDLSERMAVEKIEAVIALAESEGGAA